MKTYEEFSREDLERWIIACDEKFDELEIKNNDRGALLSIYGRLGEYVLQNKKQLASLRAERDEAVRLLKEIHSMNNIANLNDAELWNVNGEFEEKIAGIIRN